MKIAVNQDLCIGCGSCEDMAPTYFSMNDSGKVFLLGGISSKKNMEVVVFPEDLDLIKDVVKTCPVKCLEINK